MKSIGFWLNLILQQQCKPVPVVLLIMAILMLGSALGYLERAVVGMQFGHINMDCIIKQSSGEKDVLTESQNPKPLVKFYIPCDTKKGGFSLVFRSSLQHCPLQAVGYQRQLQYFLLQRKHFNNSCGHGRKCFIIQGKNTVL